MAIENFWYHPNYCEENIWHLCRHTQLTHLEKSVVFISNGAKTCPIWQMKAAAEGEPVFWDYHVVLFAKEASWFVWDLDSRLGLPVSLNTYLSQSFRRHLPSRFMPRFRIVSAAVFQSMFSSDRAHMRTQGGGWHSPPPQWPVIGAQTQPNLHQFIQMVDPFVGLVLELDQVFKAYGSP